MLLSIQISLFISAISLSVSFASLVISLYFYRQNLGISRVNLGHNLIEQRNKINQLSAQYNQGSPYAEMLGVEAESRAAFEQKGALIFYHINLLEDAWQGRKVLGKRNLQTYEDWARKIVRSWIRSDPDLIAILQHAYSNQDLHDPDFLRWLRRLIPIDEEQLSERLGAKRSVNRSTHQSARAGNDESREG